MRFATLAAWLEWLEQQHPKTIDLGLDRIAEVASRLGLFHFTAKVITVAGTNGKGSFVESVSALLMAHGKKVATYTSPHLLRFNERIRLNGQEASDEQLIGAFAAVDQCLANVSLSYFEFTTLAALWIFQRQSLDFIVLEVGLGGRLDAVNIIDPDLAVITSIGLDHQEYLGNTLESIATEKCGILRESTPLICAEAQPPLPLQQAIASHTSRVINSDYVVEETAAEWCFSAPDIFSGKRCFRLNGLSVPSQGAAICAVAHFLQENLREDLLQSTLNELSLSGRFQCFEYNGVTIILDVAHNMQAVELLAKRLNNMPLPQGNKRVAIFNMLIDKDMPNVTRALVDIVDAWFVAELDTPRACRAQTVADELHKLGVKAVSCNKNVRQALARAASICVPGDQIIAFGSFYVVAEMLSKLE